MKRGADLRKKICRRLDEAPRRVLDCRVKDKAAVLMPIVESDTRPAFLLTKRTETVATHKGQISFPGGIREAEDTSLLQTALRETQEEVGVAAGHIDIVGQFHDYLAVTDWLVVPFVGFVRGRPTLNPNPDEVERVLRIPLDFFQTRRPRVQTRKRKGRPISVYYYDYQDEVVWGLTARIIKDFMDLLAG